VAGPGSPGLALAYRTYKQYLLIDYLGMRANINVVIILKYKINNNNNSKII